MIKSLLMFIPFMLIGFFNMGQKWWELDEAEYHNISWGFRYAWGMFSCGDLDEEHKAQLRAHEHYFWIFGVFLLGMVPQGLIGYWLGTMYLPVYAPIIGLFCLLQGWILLLLSRRFVSWIIPDLLTPAYPPNPQNGKYGMDSILQIFYALGNIWNREVTRENVEKAFTVARKVFQAIVVLMFLLTVVLMAFHGQMTIEGLVEILKSGIIPTL